MKTLQVLFIVMMVFFLIPSTYSQEPAPAKFGIGPYGGFTMLYGDYPDPGIGLAGGVSGRYYFNNRFNLGLGVGFSRITDSDKFFTSYLNNVDLTANVNLTTSGIFKPYVSLGVGVFSFEYYPEKTLPLNPSIKKGDEQTYYDGAILIGGGFDFFLTPKLAFTTTADYRFSMGDDLDGLNNQDSDGSKDGYMQAKFGLTYHLGQRSQGPAEDDLLALERVEFGEVEDDILSQLQDSDDFAMFEETDDTALESRYDELTIMISQKQDEINTLQQELQYKEQRIADLESDISTGSMGSNAYSSAGGSFSDAYQGALQVYYARDFDNAIAMFQNLKQQYPNHKLSSNCDYWIGESYFGLANYQMAIQSFQNVFTHNFSYKKDDATLMLGRCYMQLNDYQNARNYLQELIDNYPDSEYINKAKQWLSRIG